MTVNSSYQKYCSFLSVLAVATGVFLHSNLSPTYKHLVTNKPVCLNLNSAHHTVLRVKHHAINPCTPPPPILETVVVIFIYDDCIGNAQ